MLQIEFLKQLKLLKNKPFLPPLKLQPEWFLTGKQYYYYTALNNNKPEFKKKKNSKPEIYSGH